MPKTEPDLLIDKYRERFKAYLGRELTFLQWCRYKTEFLESGLTLDDNSLKLFARFKRRCPRKTLDKSTLDIFKSFQIKHRTKEAWLGSEVFDSIKNLNPHIGEWQLYRAFYRAGFSFKSSREYQKDQVFSVVFYALVYGDAANERKSTRRL